jgi:hypothetical protein
MSNLLPLLFLALMGSCAAVPERVDIPEATWVPIYFKSIDAFTTKLGWTPLRQMDVPHGSLEIRVWGSGGNLACTRLRRFGKIWSGVKVIDEYTNGPPIMFEVVPRGKWDDIWRKLDAFGVLTLPDDSTLPPGAWVNDGGAYIVEINDGIHYRTYHYDNPKCQTWPEARKIIAIDDVLSNQLIPAPDRVHINTWVVIVSVAIIALLAWTIRCVLKSRLWRGKVPG